MLYGELKKYRILITFDSLTLALGAEKILARKNCPYAVIPTPMSLRTGCNTALCFPLEQKDLLDDIIDDGVVVTGIYEATEEGFKALIW